MSGRVLVVVPVLGHHDMTHELMNDLRRERGLCDVVVVDNGGDYPSIAEEVVVRPGHNLGWAAATNLGTLTCAGPEHVAFLWLNNDTRLSSGFVSGLMRCWTDTKAGLVGPFYDCHWMHQRLSRPVPVERYRPRNVHFHAPFLDGTCMFVPASTVDMIGVLDAEMFGPVGWGADIDYGLRVRDAGLVAAVTSLSYLHHEKSVTAKTVFDGLEEYGAAGYPAAIDGLRRKWGDDWEVRAGVDPATHQTAPLRWRARILRRHRWPSVASAR
ncbi:MAG: hypothetical protein QOI95_3468 [Acidimicrobiaceae bacterium]|jgi:GT2 family glycosyltransferase